jgi:hypothetical protein
MEKTARKPSMDPAQERLRQNKAIWNKEVSTFINDLIHFKKTMNGWPSKFFKERSRITQPIPADPATIIGSLAGDFQEIVQKGNSLIQEQINYTKNRRQKQPKQLNLPLPEPTQKAPEPPQPPTPDLSKQLSLGLNASEEHIELFKVASDMESKYLLESQASNPVTRFIARLFNPKFGFGEAARMRRLRMTMLDSCAKTYKTLKILQATIVKSSDDSIEQSHKMMTMAWNNWNIVYRLVTAFKGLKPNDVKESGGLIEDPELAREREAEQGYEEIGNKLQPASEPTHGVPTSDLVKDFQSAVNYLGAVVQNQEFQNLNSFVEQLKAAPNDKKVGLLAKSFIASDYAQALASTNQELGTMGSSFQDIMQQHKSKPKKEAQEFRGWLGKIRHQLIPGGTSGSRLEIYNTIDQTKKDVDALMNLLEKGYDRNSIEKQVVQIHRQMSSLRTMIRSLFYSIKPEKASSPFF